MVPAGATPASSDQEDAVLSKSLEPHAHRSLLARRSNTWFHPRGAKPRPS